MSSVLSVRCEGRVAHVSFADKDFERPDVIRAFRTEMRELGAAWRPGTVIVDFDGVIDASKESVTAILVVWTELHAHFVLRNVRPGLFDSVPNVREVLGILA